jgi:hypothetical protein
VKKSTVSALSQVASIAFYSGSFAQAMTKDRYAMEKGMRPAITP